MPKITFVEHTGGEHVVDAEIGSSVMEAAVENNVPGILAECGGSCSCATCHVYVNDKWWDKVGGPDMGEEVTMDDVNGLKPNSRLSCQIKVTQALDGLVVALPESQGDQ